MKVLKTIQAFILIAALGVSAGLFGQTPNFNGVKICVDPGHSGHESSSVPCQDDRGMPNGFWESESNLTKGLWLRDLLEARGATVIMTRETNTGVDEVDDPGCSQRMEISNANNAVLFISIHSNGGGGLASYPMTIFNGYTNNPVDQDSKDWAQVLWENLKTNEANRNLGNVF